MKLRFSPLSSFQDNYIWVIESDSSNAIWVVDPGSAEPVIDFLQLSGRNLAGILITHHHHDHIDGIPALVERYHPTCIAGPAKDVLDSVTHPVSAGESIRCLDLSFQVLELPGHTPNHIGWLTREPNGQTHLLCGDVLFSAGCGRLRGGTAEQHYHSLQQLSALPLNTLFYPAHEYTLANLAFAQQVEPSNGDIPIYTKQIEALRVMRKPSLPTTLSIEKRINPFLRCHLPTVQASVRKHFQKTDNFNSTSSLDTFTRLRQWKDQF